MKNQVERRRVRPFGYVGWFRNEAFKLFSLDLFHYYSWELGPEDSHEMEVFRLQIVKFVISFGWQVE